MSAWNPQANDIFLNALDIAAPLDRSVYVQQACHDDAELLAQVQSLIAASKKAGSFLENPALAEANPTMGQPIREATGTQIGPYKLLQQIGEGGMGTVFMAEQTEPVQRRVALKIIKPGMDSRQVIARFAAEKQALALMDHVNIARVLDAGVTEQGRPYFVMDLIHGVPITKYCDDNHLTPRHRLELFVPVCQAIQHAHQKGIIHRDIKPSNVMITLYDGKPVPKVIDFGVAKAIDQKFTEQTLFTQYGTMVGTLEYMSPEQAEMRALGVDTRSDIYSLGVLLYELLTGSTPLSREQMKEAAYGEILRLIRDVEPPKPSTRLSDSGEALASISALRRTEPAKLSKLMRGELDWIVMKTLEKDRNRRYETANAFAVDVQRYLADEPVQACPPSTWYRIRKFSRRNKLVLATAAVMGLGVIIAVLTLASSTVVIAQERDKAVKARQAEASLRKLADDQRSLAERLEKTAEKQKAQAEERELATRRYLYAAHMNLAQQAAEVPDPARAVGLLNFHRPGPGQEDLRGFEWYYWWGQSHRGLLRTLDKHTDAVFAVAFSPDGQTLASVSVDRTVKLCDVASGLERVSLTGHTDHITCVAFSPDGKTVASGSRDRTVKLWDVATSRTRATLVGHEDWVLSVAFSLDGRTLGSGSADKTIRLWDVGAERLKSAVKGDQLPLALAFSPDGKTLALGTRQSGNVGGGKLKLLELETGKTQEIFTADAHANYPTSVAFSPDGKTVAAAIYAVNGKGVVEIWDLPTGKVKATLKGHGLGLNSMAFSPDHSMLASGGEDRSVKVWDLATGEAKSTFVGHGHYVSAVAFSPDQKTLASASLDRTVKLWDLTAVEPKTNLGEHTNEVQAVAFSSDGQTVASASQDQIKLWDVASGDLKTTIKGHSEPVTTVAFSPNGKTLASASLDRTVKLWDTATGKLRIVPEERGVTANGSVRCPVAFSPDGKTVATADQEYAVRLWDADTGVHKSTLKGHASPVMSLAFSPDGKILSSVGSWDHTARLWDVATGETKFILRAQERYLWPFWTAAFSPDGKTLATGGDPAMIRLWDVATGKLKATLSGHAGVVWAVAFSPDGKTLASGAYDGTTRFWDLATGEPKVTFRHGARAIAFSPDGSILATNWENGVRLWRAATEQEVLARDRITRGQEATKQD